MGLQRVRHDWATEHAHTPNLRESSYENMMVSGAEAQTPFQPEALFAISWWLCGMDHVIPTFQLKKLSFKDVNCLLLSPPPPFCDAIQHQNTWAWVSALPPSPGPWAPSLTCLSLCLLTCKVGIHLTCPAHLPHRGIWRAKWEKTLIQ